MPQRTVVIVTRGELPSLSAKPLVGFSGSLNPPVRIFNGMLDFVDEKEVAHPYLAEELPRLNTESWRVFPDGRMETTFRLRPNLTWHDGAPLTGDDFVFAHRVYSTPELGVSGSKPIKQMQEIVAPDPRTIIVRWHEPYPEAAQMDTSFNPLPRHILEGPFQTATTDPTGFANHPFWTVDYVGAGPYKVERIEPGAFLEATAFDGHALGRPKIDRLVLRFINNANTALASIMGGQTHVLMNNVIGFEHAMVLRREAGFNDADARGKLLFLSTATTTAVTQHRPEYQQTPALHDPRVRKAIAHATDKEAIVEALFESQVPVPHTFVPREAPYYAEVDRVITKYPYDPRRTEQLMGEAGLTKDREGFFASASGERLQPALWNSAGAEREQLHAIM